MARGPKGLERLNRQLRMLPNSVRAAMSDALRDGAQQLAATIERAAPERDGDLKRSVGWSEGDPPATSATGAFRPRDLSGELGGIAKALSDAGLRFTVYAGDDKAYYARWVEHGTAAASKGQRMGARVSDRKQHKTAGRISYRTHPGSVAQPFFYPSIRALKKPLKSKVVRASNRAAKEIARLR